MENSELSKLLEKKEIIGVDFTGQRLEGIDFSGCRLERVSFKQCELVHCRFRKATIAWSDFRYANIEHGTFEEAKIEFCDFYRAFLDGVIIFNHCCVSNCSFNKTYFGSSAVIRRRELLGGRILQQSAADYEKFLTQWHLYGTGERKNDVNVVIGISILSLLLMSLLDCHFFNIGPTLFYSMALAVMEFGNEPD